MRKLALVSVWALTFSVLVGLVSTPASAQQYPPRNPRCGVSDTTLSPGDEVTVSGQHWRPGSTVTLTLRPDGIRLGSASVGAQGSFSTVVTIPTSVQPGQHRIVCTGVDPQGDPFVLATTIQILGGVVGGGAPAFTGTTLNLPLWLVIIAGLFAVAVALLVLGWRRSKAGARTRS